MQEIFEIRLIVKSKLSAEVATSWNRTFWAGVKRNVSRSFAVSTSSEVLTFSEIDFFRSSILWRSPPIIIAAKVSTLPDFLKRISLRTKLLAMTTAIPLSRIEEPVNANCKLFSVG